ncbi:MAG: hypothetical protein E6H45_14275 [Betaproteobacteria bacterium]|nr:MAG: hypothetical protein E6H45_14275 [Betaproteobacteria bacterium]
MASILDKVDVHDAGDKIILSSDDEATLRYVVEEMRREGARDIQTPVKVGGRWLASFEHPALSQCTVEKLGFEIIIAGPTEESVFARSGEFRERGALIVRGPEKENGTWKLYLDDVGARTGNTITS